MTHLLTRPDRSECADYYWTYIDEVPHEDVMDLYRGQRAASERFLAGMPEVTHGHRYAPDKWSVREVVGHVIDTERVFGFRAFSFARREPAPLPSMEQEPYAANARYDRRRMSDIVEEYLAVKRANLALFESFDADAWGREGVASGVSFTVRTIPYILVGHEIHHWKVLQERYL